MNCQEAQRLFHGYVDGELNLTESLEIDQHLHECAACAQSYADLRALQATIKSAAPYYRAPRDLPRRIQSAMGKSSKPVPPGRTLPGLWLAVAASLVIALVGGWMLARVLVPRSDEGFLAQELLASHVRSQMLPGHLVDIESSNQHKVKPFLEGKLDFSPNVPDLEAEGFHLIGGRLDYLNNRAAAALVYKRREHVITLLQWPSTQGADVAPKRVTRQNFHLVYWTQADMSYGAVSSLNETELQEFVSLIQARAR